MKKQIINKETFLFGGLFLVGLLSRTVFHLGPNIEVVTAIMVVSGFYLDKNSSRWLILLIMLATDMIIGNSPIFIFTWSGFLIPTWVFNNKSNNKKMAIFSGQIRGLTANMFFFWWTNLGVWLLDSWKMYPKTLMGLVNCYVNGLPFLRNQMMSSFIFIPILFLAIELGKIVIEKTYKNDIMASHEV